MQRLYADAGHGGERLKKALNLDGLVALEIRAGGKSREMSWLEGLWKPGRNIRRDLMR